MEIQQVIRDQTLSSLSLANHVAEKEGNNSNIVFSPMSIHVVLSLLAAGSSGITLDQILSFLRSKSTEDLKSFSSELVTIVLADGSSIGGPLLSFANGLWIDESVSLKPCFTQIAGTAFRSAFHSVDFQNKAVEVVDLVNSWIEEETKRLITEVLPDGSVDNMTRLIFANGIYFKGLWEEKFDSSNTKDYEFFLSNGGSVKAPFMTSRKKQLIRIFDGFKVLALPYKQGEDKRRFSMYFFLPDSINGISDLMKKLGSELGFLDDHLPYQKVKVGEFRIPRFKFSFGFEASRVLKEMGIGLLFEGGGLTEMVDSSMGQELVVSSIFHRSMVEVNEEGTEAAAATVGVVALRSLSVDDYVDFVADRPFVFIIREDITGVVLFVGQVLNPLVH